MKIFEIYSDNDKAKDWMCAESEHQALEFFSNHSGCHLDEIKAKEIPEDKWEHHYIIDTSAYYDDEAIEESGLDEDDFMNGYKITMTFKEYMKDVKHPDIIATTEY